MLMYGWAMVPFAHLIARLTKQPARAYLGLITGSSVTGSVIAITGSLGDFALGMFGLDPDSSTALLKLALNKWLVALPPYSLALGLVKVAANEHRTLFYKTKNDQSGSSAADGLFGDAVITTAGSWNVAGRYMFVMFVEGLAFIALSLFWNVAAHWKRERSWSNRKAAELAAADAAISDDKAVDVEEEGEEETADGAIPSNQPMADADAGAGAGATVEDTDVVAERRRVAMHRGSVVDNADKGVAPTVPYSLLVEGFSKVYASQNDSSHKLISARLVQVFVLVFGFYIGISLLFFDAFLLAMLPPLAVGFVGTFLSRGVVNRGGGGVFARSLQWISRWCKPNTGRYALVPLASAAAAAAAKRAPVAAVTNLTFGIKPGECFGLLGVNGAGKTTLFKGLTGSLLPTSGTIEVSGHDVEADLAKAIGSLGYCPQHDALCMSVRLGLWSCCFLSRHRTLLVTSSLMSGVMNNAPTA